MKQLAAHHALIPLDPQIFAVIVSRERVADHLERLRFLAYANDLTRFYAVGGDVDHLTVYDNVAMQHQLTGSGTRLGQSEAEHDVVQTALQQLQ